METSKKIEIYINIFFILFISFLILVFTYFVISAIYNNSTLDVKCLNDIARVECSERALDFSHSSKIGKSFFCIEDERKNNKNIEFYFLTKEIKKCRK